MSYDAEKTIEMIKKNWIVDINHSLHNRISISLDFDTNPKKLYPVILFTPDMGNTVTHYHVPLNKREARKLRDFLSRYLGKVRALEG